ncbi:MAG: triphosphoribosyl-dephospho-CoA synthase [Burkholderiaceae bacterium]|nr:triphosphoribosyl-dephospho-CoA synthase [Burkholderiaceae bacterium]
MSSQAEPPDAGPIHRAFLRACAWDVAVRKPGNVSRHSPGHGMAAQHFLDSAQAAAGALCAPGRRVGARIEAAMAATWARVGCNTNLGILLLCAPLAAAAERLRAEGRACTPAALRAALQAVLADLDRDDAAAAFRAIVQANPGGLGHSPQQDVREPPQVTLRAAMALAAPRDRIARQYRDGMAELFDLGLAALDRAQRAALAAAEPDGPAAAPGGAAAAAVQRLYLAWLASAPDSHLVRKQGEAVAQVVLSQAQPWAARAAAGARLDSEAGFTAWDEALKAAGFNPGTSADLTVATLMAAFLLDAGAQIRVDPGAAESGMDPV